MMEQPQLELHSLAGAKLHPLVAVLNISLDHWAARTLSRHLILPWSGCALSDISRGWP